MNPWPARSNTNASTPQRFASPSRGLRFASAQALRGTQPRALGMRGGPAAPRAGCATAHDDEAGTPVRDLHEESGAHSEGGHLMTTWILVAQRSGARIFEHETPGEGLRLVRTIDHELGRARDRDLSADRPGSTVDHNTHAHHGMRSEETPHDRVVADFVRSLAQLLEDARLEHRFTKLVLVAEPRVLGLLRELLDAPTSALVIGSLDKDYYPRDQDHLVKALGEFLRL